MKYHWTWLCKTTIYKKEIPYKFHGYCKKLTAINAIKSLTSSRWINKYETKFNVSAADDTKWQNIPIFSIYFNFCFQNILKNFDKSDPNHAIVSEALDHMTGRAQHINEMKRKHEHAVRVQEIQSTLEDYEGEDLTRLGELVLEVREGREYTGGLRGGGPDQARGTRDRGEGGSGF